MSAREVATVGDFALVTKDDEDDRILNFSTGEARFLCNGRQLLLEGIPVTVSGVTITGVTPADRSTADIYGKKCLFIGSMVVDSNGFEGVIEEGYARTKSIKIA